MAVAAVLVGGVLVAGDEGDRPAPEAGQLVLGAVSEGLSALDVPLAPDAFTETRSGVHRTETMTTSAFSMVGLTWLGAPTEVRVQVRSGGVWEPWQDLETLSDGPDARTGERTPGLMGTDLAWVGLADGVRVEMADARPDDLNLALLQADPSTAPPSARTAVPVQRKPRLLSREAWGADPDLRTGTPTYNRTIQQVHVHHTVNSNAYAAADVPGLIRGMYRYHTQNLGWSDLGYNFVVDRFGRTWIGRAGGAKKPVRGAHTLGFNSTSTGVAVLGNFETAGPGRKAVTALVHLAAWKLARYGRNPEGRVTVYSHGSDRYAAGRKVRLPTIDGHRDTNDTACPGINLYRKIPAIRTRAADRVKRF